MQIDRNGQIIKPIKPSLIAVGAPVVEDIDPVEVAPSEPIPVPLSKMDKPGLSWVSVAIVVIAVAVVIAAVLTH